MHKRCRLPEGLAVRRRAVSDGGFVAPRRTACFNNALIASPPAHEVVFKEFVV